MQFFRYLKSAFLNRWNLLAFLGGTAFAFLSGRPDVLLPLVLACETAYIGLPGTHPRFRQYVDAQTAKAAREANTISSQKALRQILRLLYTQFALSRFLKRTGADEINKGIQRLEERLQRLPAGDDPQTQRVRKALEDNLETSRLRLANLAKATDNFQFVQLEIDRLENEIRSLSELAVNRQEPDFISSQVDRVASSTIDTERAMNELQFATGLDAADDQTPELMRSKTLQFQR